MEKRMMDVLRSKRFVTILVGLMVMLVVAAFPQFASAEEQIIGSVTFIVLLAISGYSLTDIALAWLSQPGNVDVTVNTAQAGVDYLENKLQIDIPEPMEVAAKEELRKRLQGLVDGAYGKAPAIPPQEVNVNISGVAS